MNARRSKKANLLESHYRVSGNKFKNSIVFESLKICKKFLFFFTLNLFLSSAAFADHTISEGIIIDVNSHTSNIVEHSFSTAATNTWSGSINNDWYNPLNWSFLAVPTSSTDVAIGWSLSNSPVISSSTIASVKNLTISSGANLQVNGTLQISGAITNSGSLIATSGTISMNGSKSQTIAGSMFYNKTIANLIVDNTSGSGLFIASTANDTLKISGTLTFGYIKAKLHTNDNLNLLSTSTGTASIGIVGSKNVISGKVIVDRYISLGTGSGQHGKSWQLLSTPTNGQTIKQSWMEDQRSASGYGTLVTGPGGTAAGFDFYSPGGSIKSYDDATNSWIGVSNTNNEIYNPNGYMIFLRGDRTVNGTTVTTPTPTILRTNGNLNTGTQSSINVLADHYQSIGNPYASPVDFSLLTRTGGLDNKFYAWDPFLHGTYGYGGYQTISGSNNWEPVPGGTSAYPSSGDSKVIQSGQAVFVHATGTAASISFNENSKVTGSTVTVNFARKANRIEASQRQFLRVSLFTGPESNAPIADGNAVAFDESFSNNIDGDDALKLSNSGENFGIKRAGKILAVEAKAPVTANDTIYYNMSNLKWQTYQLRFVPENMQTDNLQAFLLDKFLNTSTPISLKDSSFVNISISSDVASAAPDRFKIVFSQTAALPVTLTSIKANQNSGNISIEWNVENESGIQTYEIEKSLNGSNFTLTGSIAALNESIGEYEWSDDMPLSGYNYYRIHIINKDGEASYSKIVKVFVGASDKSISIFPNPIVNGVINLQFQNQSAGKYSIKLFNSLGAMIIKKEFVYSAGNNKETLHCPLISKGIYHLEISKPDGSLEVIKVVN